jgi:hypothetical protein
LHSLPGDLGGTRGFICAECFEQRFPGHDLTLSSRRACFSSVHP